MYPLEMKFFGRLKTETTRLILDDRSQGDLQPGVTLVQVAMKIQKLYALMFLVRYYPDELLSANHKKL